MELEARVQAAEDARRQTAEQLNELTTKQQRTIAKQVIPSVCMDVSRRHTKTRLNHGLLLHFSCFLLATVYDTITNDCLYRLMYFIT